MPDEKSKVPCEAEGGAQPRKGFYLKIAALAVAVCLLGAAGGVAGSYIFAGSGPAVPDSSALGSAARAQAASDESDGDEPSADADEQAHDHSWSAVYQLREVPAVTHVEHHDAQYGSNTAYETVCNECSAIVTGATREHTQQTGHSSFTSDVPIVNDAVVAEAYDETVVDVPATVELVHTADRCTTCGEERDVEDVVVQTMDGTTNEG